MKSFFLKLILITFPFFTIAQDTNIEPSIWGIQTGFLGAWVHNETRLADQIALRTELGFNSVIFGGSLYDETVFVFAPVITLEPRWYFNLNKRASKEKNIAGNAGNFISINSSYHPDWFVISNDDDINTLDQVSFVPTWGIRRNIGAGLNYEAGIGLGYRYIFAKNAGYQENKSEAALNLHLRIGYKF